MALSKEARIKIFIGIDLAFFLLEIIVGYSAHSLALVADAFHMLNDVISLCVGLWAVKVATTKGSSNEMTYGWARAEILGGLINGVFLVALCLSIFLQAIERFFEPQEVSNPKLVLVVGGVGLVFNILGLFVFHQHSHDHGHDHGGADELNAAESGHAHDHAHDHVHEHGAKHKHVDETSADSGSSGATKVPGITWNIPPKPQNSESSSRARLDRLSISSGRRTGSISSRIEDLPISPRVYRDDIINKARMQGEDPDDENSVVDEDDEEEETTSSDTRVDEHPRPTEQTPLITHSGHEHNQPRKKVKSGGHNHDDMNLRGMFLHFLGDALGNVGVMATALIIWLAAPWKPRFYFDPAISLVITAIILKTAIPLCVETAKPLLQAVPEDISVEDVAKDIESLPGIKKCRHLHVWALTPMKRIATLDVVMDFGYDAQRYTDLIKEIKTCLHAYGLHNSTVQPQFLDTPALGSLECGDGQEPDLKCCTPVDGDLKLTIPDPHHGHDHSS